MNLKLNMKDINKILAKAHLKYNFFLNDAKKTTILWKHVSMKQLVCLHFSIMLCEGRSQVSLFFFKCGEPWYHSIYLCSYRSHFFFYNAVSR